MILVSSSVGTPGPIVRPHFSDIKTEDLGGELISLHAEAAKSKTRPGIFLRFLAPLRDSGALVSP